MTTVEIAEMGTYQVERHAAGWMLDGELCDARLQGTGHWRWELTRSGRRYEVILHKYDPEQKLLQLKVDGKMLRMRVERREDRLLQTIGKLKPQSQRVQEFRSPMPALVRKVEVQAGQQVAQGERLMVLEAMKMENILKSPQAGTIAEVAVTEGQAVEKNALLLRFE